jgi:transposase
MRKSIDGLCNIVQYSLEQEPVSDRLYVFCNRQRNKLKILQWEGNGFWLHYKRLETDHFLWLGIDDEQLSISVTEQQLNWLLDGLPLHQPKAHRQVIYYFDNC